MLRRVISIENVGRFRSSAATPNPGFAKHTFIFGGNGFGKTTFCTVMRSVQSGDAAPLLGRQTLGSNRTPEIDLLFCRRQPSTSERDLVSDRAKNFHIRWRVRRSQRAFRRCC